MQTQNRRFHLTLAGLATAALTAAALTLGCASSPRPVAQELQLERVVVAPINLTVRLADELQGSEEPVWQELVAFLTSQNREISVLDRVEAEYVWEDVLAEIEKSGATPDLATAMAQFARRTAAGSSYDVLVIPSLVVRRARVQGLHARWDGVRRPLSLLAAPNPETVDMGAYIATQRGFRGSIASSSLHIAILNARGETVFDGLGGLALLEEADRDRQTVGKPWTLALRERPFDVPDQLREGIEVAFAKELRGIASAR